MGLTKYDHNLHNRYNLTLDDECYYFIEATDGGYNESQSNNLLHNFKKPIEYKNQAPWAYRNKAITNFASKLATIRSLKEDNLTIIPAPTSKKRASKEFNDRIDATVKKLKENCPNLTIEYAFDAKNDVLASHRGGSRDLNDIRENIVWLGLQNKPSEIIIFIDDTLTTGAHFKVCKEIILEHYPQARVIGVFLALFKWKTHTIEEIDLPFST